MKKTSITFAGLFMLLAAMFCCFPQTFAQNSTGLAPRTQRSHSLVSQSMQMRSLSSEAVVCIGGTDISHFTLGNPANVTSYGATSANFTNSVEYYSGGYYFANSSGEYGTIDASTGQPTIIASGTDYSCISFNPADGQMYAISSGSAANLYTIDIATGASTQVVSVNGTYFILGMAITNDGRFCVIDAEADGICELNPTTGSLTPVAVLGFTVNYGQDLSVDREENVVYWAAYNADANEAQLYAIDLTAGTGNLIGAFPNQASGFAIQTEYNQDIAAAPSNFTVTPGANNALTATITWNNPSQTLGGDPLTSITSVELYRGATLLQSFSNPTVGGAMTYTDNSITIDGNYSYRAYAVTSEGNGASASASAQIGTFCNIHFELHDSFGDGWNGASIGLYRGNELAQSVSCSDSLFDGDIALPIGTYDFVWTAGSYDSECSMTITDGFGYQIYSGNAPAAGTFAQFDHTCAAQEPNLHATPSTLSFTTGTGMNATPQVVSVSGFQLTDDITVTVSAPFQISEDNNTYGQSLTLPRGTTDQTNASFYVTFAPTTAGTFSETITLTSGTLSASVAVEGEAVSCDPITSFPYNCNYTDETQLLCWNVIDNNMDDRTFTFNATTDGGARYTYSSTNPADDWLISPEFVLTGDQYLSFDYYIASTNYPEAFSVHIIQGSTDEVLVPTTTYTNTAAENLLVGLSDYTGTYRIGIHAESNADMYYLYINNFMIGSSSDLDASLTATPDAINFGTIILGNNASASVEVTTVSPSEAVDVTTDAPFEVSLDGTTYATSVTIPATTALTNTTTLYVRYTPAAVGSDNGSIALTNGSLTANVTLSGAGVDCSAALSVPFTEDFENGINPCWQNLDNDGDSYAWMLYTDVFPTLDPAGHSGTNCITSASYINNVGALSPENWLVTPEFSVPAEGATLSWWSKAVDPSFAGDYYEVRIGVGGNYTTVFALSGDLPSDWEYASIALADYAGQNITVAFVHTNSNDEYIMMMDDISVAPGVGVEENEAAQVRVYPNPATSTINVEAQGFEQYQVVNMLGQSVVNGKLMNGTTQINVSNLTNGVYFVRLINGSSVETIKVVKK
jgi:hypothetical protein